MIRRVVRYTGRVQGVGFRFTTQRISRNYEVSGYVKNIQDGHVELVVEGSAAQVNAFLRSIAEALGDYIHDAHIEEQPPSCEFDNFEIRH